MNDGQDVTTTILTKTTIAAITAAPENIEASRTPVDHRPRDTMMTTFQIATLPDDVETRAGVATMMTTMTTTDVTVETEIETGTDGETRAFPRR